MNMEVKNVIGEVRNILKNITKITGDKLIHYLSALSSLPSSLHTFAASAASSERSSREFVVVVVVVIVIVKGNFCHFAWPPLLL